MIICSDFRTSFFEETDKTNNLTNIVIVYVVGSSPMILETLLKVEYCKINKTSNYKRIILVVLIIQVPVVLQVVPRTIRLHVLVLPVIQVLVLLALSLLVALVVE
jgi:hypothetical protein